MGKKFSPTEMGGGGEDQGLQMINMQILQVII